MQKDPERFKIDKKSIKELKQKIEERERILIDQVCLTNKILKSTNSIARQIQLYLGPINIIMTLFRRDAFYKKSKILNQTILQKGQ